MQGHPGPAAGHYTPFPGHGPPPRSAGFSRGRALPVMVACGLAMGVFVGLVVVRGTGEAEGAVTATVTPAPPSKQAETTPVADPAPAAEPAQPAEPPPVPADPTALLTFNVSPKHAVV